MKFIIEGELTDLNTYINAERTNRFIASKIKKQETERVAWSLAGQPQITAYPLVFSFTWYTKDLRKDADNVVFAKKFILDGMVLAGVLTDDSRRFVMGFGGEQVLVDKDRPRVEVELVHILT